MKPSEGPLYEIEVIEWACEAMGPKWVGEQDTIDIRGRCRVQNLVITIIKK